METTESPSRNTFRVGLIAGGCLLIALAGILLPSRSPAPPAAASAPPAAAPVKPAAPSATTSAVEPRVTFAHTMPRNHGSQVYNNTGTPNPDMVMVAIPDGTKGVRFVRGSAPEAIQYLAQATAAQQLVVTDNGPANVDTSEMTNYGPLKGRTTRRVRLGAAPGK